MRTPLLSRAKHLPIPTSVHSEFPSFFFIIRYTFVRISYFVSSSSSPSPSASCADAAANNGGASSTGVSARDDASVSPPASLASADFSAGGAPNENPPNLDVDAAGAGLPSSGVFGGLPKPKPTGLPMLPGAAAPNVKAAGREGEVAEVPKGSLVGVEVGGLSDVPNVRPPANALVLDAEGASVFSESFSFELSADEGNRLLEKIEGVEEGNADEEELDGVSLLLDESPNEKGLLPDDGAPNEKADFRGAVDELLSVLDFSPKVKEADFVESS